MKRSPPRGQRGFTLIELLIGAVTSSIVLASVVVAVLAVNSAYQNASRTAQAAESGRNATAVLERMLKLAGYGVDPQYAFDFDTTNLTNVGTTKDNYTGTTTSPSYTTDDLAFRYRDPAYLRRGALASGAGITSATLNIDTTFGATYNTVGVAMKSGQPLILACPGAQDYWVVKTTAVVNATDVSIPVAGYGTPFANGSVPTCLVNQAGQSSGYIFLLYDIRIRVKPINGHPYLVIFHDLNDPTSDTDYDPIAGDVEDFEVSYAMNQPPPNTTVSPVPTAMDSSGNSDWIMEDAAGETWPTPQAIRPTYNTSNDDKLRYTADPANIRQIRLSLVIRQLQPDGSKARTTQMKVENHTPSSSTADNYFRTLVTTTVRTGNMASHSFFLPPLANGASGTDLNVWGG